MRRQKIYHLLHHLSPLLLVFVLPCVLYGQGFYDDFSDGSATDGKPVAWFEDTGSFIVDENDTLVLTYDPERGFAAASLPGLVLRDTSIRTTLRMVEGDSIGVAGRYVPPGGFKACYGATIDKDGVVAIGQCGIVNSFLGERDTDLDVTKEDVVLQFDMIGNTLSAWAWRPGEPMPNEPLVSVEDPTLQSGEIRVAVIGDPSSAQFRSVQVDTKHIPEPSSCILCFLGLLSLLPFRRRR